MLRDASLDRPGDADIHSKMATVLVELGRFEEAVQIFGKVARVEPGRAAEFGHSLWQQQRHAEAIRVYGQGLEAAPEDRMLNRLLAWSLATCPVERLRDGRRALTIARRLSEATSSSNPEFLDTLAAAQAATGDFPGAARNARRGLEILERVLRARPAAGMTGQQRHRLEELSKGLHARAALYSRGLPYREEE